MQAVSRLRSDGAGRIVAAVLLAIGLAGCGGGGGSPVSSGSTSTPMATLLGTFTDAPVVGAKYLTSSGSGGCTSTAPCTTDSLGQFKYADGDTVTFMASGVTLGTTNALHAGADGSTVVTPVTLVAGAKGATDPGPTAIAQFLQTLSAVNARTTGANPGGMLTMPSTSVDATLSSQLSSATADITAAIQKAIDTAFGAGMYQVVPTATAQSAMMQGINSSGIVGTVWAGPCTNSSGVVQGNGTMYFQPGGTLSGFTDGGRLISGSWTGSTAANAGVTLQAFTTGGRGATATGTIAAGASTGSAVVKDASGTQCTFNFTKVAASQAATTTQYLGGWYVTYTPNPAGLAAGDTGGTAYLVAAADGTFNGITDGGEYFSGSWTVTSGLGTATFKAAGSTQSVSIDLSTQTGTVLSGGVSHGDLKLSRDGVLQLHTSPGPVSGGTTPPAMIPLLLSVVDSWPNTATSASSFSIALNLYDASGKSVSGTSKSESTALSSSGVRTTTTDNLSVSYPSGGAATYQLTIGSTGNSCSITGGTRDANGNSVFTGPVNDANSGNASAYPTVYVTCVDLNPLSPPTATSPLLLPVSISWANTATSVSSFALALDIRDAKNNVVAGAVKSERISLNTSGVRSTTTDSIAASYPVGVATVYQPRISNVKCSFVGGTIDTNGDSIFNGTINASSSFQYPTLQVTCN